MLLVDKKQKQNLPKLGKSRRFELLNSQYEDNRVINKRSGKKHIRKNVTYRLPAVYTRFNKDTNQPEEYRYAVREIPVRTGKEAGITRYAPDKITFTSSTLVVSVDQPDLYEFLVQSPWIEKDGNNNPKFRELDPVRDSVSRLEKEKIKNKAKSVILNDVHPELTLRRVLAALLGDSTEHHIDIVKDKLLTFAESKPKEFLDAIGSKDTEIKSMITELTHKQVISLNPDKRQWEWGAKTADAGNMICQCPQGKNETDWLVDTLLREKELMKSFKQILGRRDDSNKTDERKELERKSKALKCGKGMAFMSDEQLQAKIDATTQAYHKEMDNENTAPSRRTMIDKMLVDAGELIKTER